MIDLSNISLQFTGEYLFQNVNLKINSGDKICLVGSNGSGKSSLLKIISGEIPPESGFVQKQKNISTGYLPQEQIIHKGKKLIDEVKSALTNIQTLHKKEKDLLESLSDQSISEEVRNDLVHQLGEVQHRLEELDSYTADHRAEKILSGLGFSNNDFNRLTDEFSGGWQMRIALAKILIAQNDLLLIDEPTNHLDLDSLQWLTNFIQKYEGAMLVVSHDRNFVNETTSKTIEIYNGSINLYNGKLDDFLKYKVERDRQLIHQKELQGKKIKEIQKFIERFRYKATKAKQVQSRIKQLEKIEQVSLPESEKEIIFNFPEAPASGVVNIELKDIYKSFGSLELFKGIDFTVNRGDKIAFVGPNGAGKTTLAKIISGKLNFDEGERIPGHNTIISYYSQDVADSLNPDLDLMETLELISPDKNIQQLRSLLGAFLFSGDNVFKKVKVLSGGEKSRVALAKILLSVANFIILDEPTNHLDLASKSVLQKALMRFNGSLILVSHDIDFLLPIVNRVVDIRNGEIKIYEGGIEYYLRKREEYLENHASNYNDPFKDQASKKELKRIEADKRQKRYAATKDLKERLAELEKEIELLETEEVNINKVLFNPDLYDDRIKARELNLRINEIKNDLGEKLTKWELLSKEIEKIEREFA